ncbi:MAG: hypothetical protein ACT6FE_08515, partial [Methanosarcinaceae archaeon]
LLLNSRNFLRKNVIIHGRSRKAVRVVMIIKYGGMVIYKRFLMVITSRYCLSFIVVLFAAVLSDFDLQDILSVFRRKLKQSALAYPIKKNTTNGFQAFPPHGSVTGLDPYNEELKHTCLTHGLRA